MQNNEHGGNIYRLIAETDCEMRQVIDFSASINPLGVSEKVLKAIKDNLRYLCHYPDPDAKILTMEISQHFDIDPHHILCGNGSTELIYLIVRALRPKQILIPAPTFSEYERACKTAGLRLKVKSLRLKSENNFDISPEEFIKAFSDNLRHSNSKFQPCDMAFLCNPNNPTGRLLRKEDVIKIAEAARDFNCYLVVDEAFIDFCPEHSVAMEVQNNPYLIVLRSMTKFFALSGIRIGYGIFPVNVIDTIKNHKEPWTVNTIAQIAGIAALNDIEYKNKTFKVIRDEKIFIEKGLNSLGITYFPSEANFYLIRHKKANKIISLLKDSCIIVRNCTNFKGLDNTYMRIAVRSRDDNSKLLKRFERICEAL
jgi:threonine-phosphate decarboxylase